MLMGESNFQENKALNNKDDTSVETTSIRSLPPLRMKPETSNLRLNIPHQVSEVSVKRKCSWSSTDSLSNKIIVSSVNDKNFGKLQTIPSRKCTVLDLLFDREVSVKILCFFVVCIETDLNLETPFLLLFTNIHMYIFFIRIS